MAEVRAGQPRQRLARRGHEHARGGAARQDVLAFEDDGGGPALERLTDVPPAVLAQTGDRDEHVTGVHFPRVVGDAGDARGQGAEHRLVREGLEERGEWHRGPAH